MKSKREDRRIKYTKRVIKQSLIDLLKNRPIDKVTVTDICKTADINRSTFYTHYSNPYNLLESIENELFEKVKKSIGTNEIETTVNEIFNAIANNKELFKVLFSSHKDYRFLIKFFGTLYNNSIETFKSYFNVECGIDLEYLYRYIITGSAAISYTWIKNGLKESPDEMGSLVNKLIRHTMDFKE